MRKYIKKTKHRLPRKIKKAYKSSNLYWEKWGELYEKLQDKKIKIEHYDEKADKTIFELSDITTKMMRKKHHRSRLSVTFDLYCSGWCPKCPINFCCEHTVWK